MHWEFGDVMLVDLNLTAFRGNQAGNHVEAGGFTRAIGTKQPDHFAA